MTQAQKRSNPAGAGLSRTTRNISGSKVTTQMDALRGLYGRPRPPTVAPIDLLLPRLANLRSNGNSHRADCPVGHSSKGSLSVSVGDDGKLLMTCFVCHDTPGIVAALGLELANLFPQRLAPSTPEQRKELSELARQGNWRAALSVIDREATVVLIASGYADRGERLTDEDHIRLQEACSRITRAREVLCDRR
jgi:hypothetical protein